MARTLRRLLRVLGGSVSLGLVGLLERLRRVHDCGPADREQGHEGYDPGRVQRVERIGRSRHRENRPKERDRERDPEQDVNGGSAQDDVYWMTLHVSYPAGWWGCLRALGKLPEFRAGALHQFGTT